MIKQVPFQEAQKKHSFEAFIFLTEASSMGLNVDGDIFISMN